MKYFFVTCFILIYHAKTHTQKLIPDGSFELISNSECINPSNGFAETFFWYSIQGTPDLFVANCPLPTNGEIFWTDGSQAAEGRNYVGIRSRVNANQTYLSEGIATQLIHPLEADTPYFILIKTRSKGFYQGFPTEVISCPLKPEKKIEIYVHTDSIFVENDFSNGTSESNAELVAKVESETLSSDQVFEDWSMTGTCFTVSSTATYLAISMPIGNFGTFPACAADDTQGTFYSFYYELDDVKIIKLPESLDTIIYTRNSDPLDLYLPEIFELEFLDGVEYFWSDGYEGSNRRISQEGKYEISAVLECGEIRLNLTVINEDLELPFYIPTAFSPNDDGINDLFQVFAAQEVEILTYQLLIFDKWGNRIFKSETADFTWDGMSDGRMVDVGTYIYVMVCEILDKGRTDKFTASGSLSVLK